jgi:hypothetical protein
MLFSSHFLGDFGFATCANIGVPRLPVLNFEKDSKSELDLTSNSEPRIEL